MAYQSLYRRYRPRRFAEVRGQADVVRALRNAVREGRVGHAYLFSGPRGTGKTSTARILAKALNCTDLRDGEPCCECESCLAIEAGTSYDLQELDAASNNGVDAMRTLIERTAMGSPGRTKVYILDEVHMLSTAASNALLKTLEEPPAHVVFVLATTDPQKVLPTIRSRTQHFEFHLLPADELAEHVQWVIADAGLTADAEAVDYVLRAGGGSARDTLSALDQVVAAGGVPDRGDDAAGLVEALASSDTGAALVAVSEAVRRGRDPRVLGEALLGRLRDVFLQRMGDPLEHLPDADRALAAQWAERFSDRAVTRSLEAVGDALREMRQAPDARIPLEVALVRLTRSTADASVEALVLRVERLETALASGATPTPPATTSAPAPAPPTSGAGPAPSAPPAPPEVAGSPAPGSAADREAPPARPSGRTRGAEAAHAAAEAARRSTSSRGPAPERPSARSSSVPAPPPPPGRGPASSERPPDSPQPGPDPVPDTPAAPDPPGPDGPADSAGPEAAAGRGPTDGALPDRDALTLAWADDVLPRLKNMTKALFQVGRFVESGDTVVIAVPGGTHIERCEERRGEVEAALAAHFGRPVPVRLTAEGESSGATAGSRAPRSNGDATNGGAPDGDRPQRSAPDPIEAERVEVGDIAELADAPPDHRSPVDRLAEAFPGAEVVEEA